MQPGIFWQNASRGPGESAFGVHAQEPGSKTDTYKSALQGCHNTILTAHIEQKTSNDEQCATESELREKQFEENSKKFHFEVKKDESAENHGFTLKATDNIDFLVYKTTVTQETIDLMGVTQKVEIARKMLEVAIDGETPDELHIRVGFVEQRTSGCEAVEGVEGSEGIHIAHPGDMEPERKNTSDFLVLKLTVTMRFAQETFWYELPVVGDELGLSRLLVERLKGANEQVAQLEARNRALEESLKHEMFADLWCVDLMPACTFCHKIFASNHGARMHFDAKHENQMWCEICFRGFTTTQGFQAHAAAKHMLRMRNVLERQ